MSVVFIHTCHRSRFQARIVKGKKQSRSAKEVLSTPREHTLSTPWHKNAAIAFNMHRIQTKTDADPNLAVAPVCNSSFFQFEFRVVSIQIAGLVTSGIAPSTTETAATLPPSALPLRSERAEMTSAGSSKCQEAMVCLELAPTVTAKTFSSGSEEARRERNMSGSGC